MVYTGFISFAYSNVLAMRTEYYAPQSQTTVNKTTHTIQTDNKK